MSTIQSFTNKVQELNNFSCLPIQLDQPIDPALIKEKIGIQTPEELLKKNELIAHSLDVLDFSEIEGLGAVDFGFCRQIFNQFHGKAEPVTNLSATLLVGNSNVNIYRNVGILLDYNHANIKLASIGDANSCSNAKGDLNISKDNMMVPQLAHFIQTTTTDRPLMNEVKGDFSCQSLVGLYFSKIANQREENKHQLAALLIQKHITKQHSRKIDIFRYDPTKGTIEKVEPDAAQRKGLYSSVTSLIGRKSIEVVSQTLGDGN